MKLTSPIRTKVFLKVEDILGLTQKKKKQGQKLVFTNGCFDILHAGHLDYLEKASQVGDFFIVGLNSDQSVSRLKGKQRPIINESDRAMLLASLEYVDAVCVFDEDTPLKLIEKLVPDVLVKGADYNIDSIVGAKVVLENGGEVKTIEFVHQLSTSDIIERIKSL